MPMRTFVYVDGFNLYYGAVRGTPFKWLNLHTNESATIVQRLWNYCNVLRDDGVSYGDYVEQLTYLLFLKMADEQTKPPYKKRHHPGRICLAFLPEPGRQRAGKPLPPNIGRARQSGGMLGIIFRKAQNRIQDPAKLKRLLALIDEETWMGLDIDIKGEIYEGLLQKNAQDTKSGAGQYFTPRPLIKAMVEVMRPEPGMTLCDPACGTGGFFWRRTITSLITIIWTVTKSMRCANGPSKAGRSWTTPPACA
jgi:type I restriction enzyme M protein